jgi:hypothetical protein
MGNHEFCMGCGMSDFHCDYACEQVNPEGRKRVLREQAERKAEHERGEILLDRMKVDLMALYKLDSFDVIVDGDKLYVYGFALARAEKRRRNLS